MDIVELLGEAEELVDEVGDELVEVGGEVVFEVFDELVEGGHEVLGVGEGEEGEEELEEGVDVGLDEVEGGGVVGDEGVEGLEAFDDDELVWGRLGGGG